MTYYKCAYSTTPRYKGLLRIHLILDHQGHKGGSDDILPFEVRWWTVKAVYMSWIPNHESLACHIYSQLPVQPAVIILDIIRWLIRPNSHASQLDGWSNDRMWFTRLTFLVERSCDPNCWYSCNRRRDMKAIYYNTGQQCAVTFVTLRTRRKQALWCVTCTWKLRASAEELP